MSRENTREGIDAAVDDFAVHMKQKLLMTRHHEHWKNLPTKQLFLRLLEEARELELAINAGGRKDVVSEAADVANFAMMIADNEQWGGTRAWNSKEGR